MEPLTGKVAVVSGAARGQGRAHAIELARQGADIVAFDICEPLVHPGHPAATEGDLKETQAAVEALGCRIITSKTDARDLAGLQALSARAMEEFGRIDILVVNHGIWTVAPSTWELEEDSWNESIDVLLSGAWKVTKAFVPHIIAGDRGGSVVLTSSVMGTIPQPGSVAYTVSKHGILGLMKTLAVELGRYRIRVNAVSPASIATPMAMEGDNIERSTEWYPLFFGTDRSLLPVGWVEPEVVAKVVRFLVSDDAAHLTGVDLPVDGGWSTF
ncbi:mycofactocin-coupled SDR family oxidoreductase [soil metagenome]